MAPLVAMFGDVVAQVTRIEWGLFTRVVLDTEANRKYQVHPCKSIYRQEHFPRSCVWQVIVLWRV